MRGYGHAARGAAPLAARPFSTHQFAWGLNLGVQLPYWQAGGPSGFAGGTSGAVKPWPYITGFKNFIAGMPSGAASTLMRNPIGPNLASSALAFIPIGYTKQQTYTGVSF